MLVSAPRALLTPPPPLAFKGAAPAPSLTLLTLPHPTHVPLLGLARPSIQVAIFAGAAALATTVVIGLSALRALGRRH